MPLMSLLSRYRYDTAEMLAAAVMSAEFIDIELTLPLYRRDIFAMSANSLPFIVIPHYIVTHCLHT